MGQPGTSSWEPPSHQVAAVLVPYQYRAGAGCHSPVTVTTLWSHATWAEVQPVPFPGAQVIGTLFYALMPRYPQPWAGPMLGSGQGLRCGAVWDGMWPLHCSVLMAPMPSGSPAWLDGKCQGSQAQLAAVMMAAVSGQGHLLEPRQEGSSLGQSWELWGGLSPGGDSGTTPSSGNGGCSSDQDQAPLLWAGAVSPQQGLRVSATSPHPGAWDLGARLSRTVNTLCATFFSGTLGAGRG